jgi:hypothetical protein
MPQPAGLRATLWFLLPSVGLKRLLFPPLLLQSRHDQRGCRRRALDDSATSHCLGQMGSGFGKGRFGDSGKIVCSWRPDSLIKSVVFIEWPESWSIKLTHY